ncbi:MAG: hypothetical protein HQM03_07340 [Magnetococcales bacterium]|nr:hypothetical protein [Magnetococcales bacterium]
MNTNRAEILITSASEDGQRSLEIAMQNINEKSYEFMHHGMPNSGTGCVENEQRFQDTLSMTVNLLARSIREANEAAKNSNPKSSRPLSL